MSTERWHYVEWDEGRQAMLLDRQSDPHELKNLAEDASRSATVQEMKRLLKLIPPLPAK